VNTKERVGPFFKQFGSKWSAAKLYPEPEWSSIIEPFAGGAGYACLYPTKNVVLYDTDENLSALWRWLIKEATPGLIRAIPLHTQEGTDIRTMNLLPGQQLLLKHWQRTNNVGNCWTISAWGNMPGQFTESTRSRLADQIGAIKHWSFAQPDYSKSATWFFDPPYQSNYAYRQPLIDFSALAILVKSLYGQVIVCEGGESPNWLPFKPLATRVTSRRTASNNHHCKEWIWTSSRVALTLKKHAPNQPTTHRKTT